MVRGRDFSDQDTASSPQVALVNETFVKRFFPKEDPIGKHFGIDLPKYSGSWEIVGVFRDFKVNNPREEIRPVFLRPLTQKFTGFTEPEMIGTEVQSMFMNAMVINFNSPQQNVDTLVRNTLAGIDPNLTVMDLRSLDAQIGALRRDVLLCCAAHRGDRHPHGAGRHAGQRHWPGSARRALADSHRARAWNSCLALRRISDEEPALRGGKL
jgi:hypothetical protein